MRSCCPSWRTKRRAGAPPPSPTPPLPPSPFRLVNSRFIHEEPLLKHFVVAEIVGGFCSILDSQFAEVPSVPLPRGFGHPHPGVGCPREAEVSKNMLLTAQLVYNEPCTLCTVGIYHLYRVNIPVLHQLYRMPYSCGGRVGRACQSWACLRRVPQVARPRWRRC